MERTAKAPIRYEIRREEKQWHLAVIYSQGTDGQVNQEIVFKDDQNRRERFAKELETVSLCALFCELVKIEDLCKVEMHVPRP